MGQECLALYEPLREECCQDYTYWDSTAYPVFQEYYDECTCCIWDDEIPDPECDTSPICNENEQHCNAYFRCEGLDDLGGGYKCTNGPEGYVRNTYLLEHATPGCTVESIIDTPHPFAEELELGTSTEARQIVFKSQFDYVSGTGSQPGYYAYDFALNMNSVESGGMGQFGVLAPGNFNYRIRNLAVNVVGTDVLDCSQAESPSTCAANPWVSYDMVQMGEVFVRNHHEERSVRAFSVPTGVIRGGKAWTAEQVIGFPISGAHQTALTQLYKASLMGRPMEGQFQIRIYDVPELDWDNVEDVQIVLGYHYWTRSE